MIKQLLLFSFTLSILVLSAQKIDTQFWKSDGAYYSNQYTLALPDDALLMVGSIHFPDSSDTRILVTKMDKDGEEIWSKVTHLGEALWADQFDDGQFVICGKKHKSDTTDYTGFVLKLTSEGEPVWEQDIPWPARNQANCVNTRKDGGVAVCGDVLTAGKSSAFILLLDHNGTTTHFKTLNTPDVTESSGFEIITDQDDYTTLFWGNLKTQLLTNFKKNGTKRWQEDLEANHFSGQYFLNKKVLWHGLEGEVLIAGHIPKSGSSTLLAFGDNGVVDWSANFRAMQTFGFSVNKNEPDQTYNIYFSQTSKIAKNESEFVHLRLNSSGGLVASDTLNMPFSEAITQYIYVGNTVLLKYGISPVLGKIEDGKYSKQPIPHQYSNSTPYQFRASARTNSGGTIIAESVYSFMENQLSYRLRKIDPTGKEIAWSEMIAVPTDMTTPQLTQLQDGNVLFLSSDKGIKLDSSLNLSSVLEIPYGYLFPDNENGFCVYTIRNPAKALANVTFRRYDEDGNMLEEHEIFKFGLPETRISHIQSLGNGSVTIWSHPSIGTTDHYFNQVFWIDTHGRVTDTLKTEGGVLFNPKMAVGTDGVIVAFEIKKTNASTYLQGIGIKSDKQIWHFRHVVPDEQETGITSIEQAPDGGFVVALFGARNSSYFLREPVSRHFRTLLHIDPNGQLRHEYTYFPFQKTKPLLNGFIPGFVHEEWGNVPFNPEKGVFYQVIRF